MDPQLLSRAEWAEVGTALKFLWLALGFALIAGPSLMTAHAFIPSAIGTRTIPEKWDRLRAPLYLLGIVCVIGIFTSLFMVSQNLQFLHDMYPRWWQ